MARTTLIIGGCRSGKSSHALALGAQATGNRRLFVATCQPHDAEMKERIHRHQLERGDQWQTEETPIDIVGVIQHKGPETDIMLIDCLTLWVNNLLMAHEDDSDIRAEMNRLYNVIQYPPCSVILVSNEVGTGIVPENPLARRFRDLTGWCNQNLAARCTDVVWMVAGIPVTIKPSRA